MVTIDWYDKNNQQIKNSTKYKILTNKLPDYNTFDKQSVLEIANLTTLDDGTYECRAEIKTYGIKKSVNFDLFHSKDLSRLKFCII